MVRREGTLAGAGSGNPIKANPESRSFVVKVMKISHVTFFRFGAPEARLIDAIPNTSSQLNSGNETLLTCVRRELDSFLTGTALVL